MKKMFNNVILNKVMLGLLGVLLSIMVVSAMNMNGIQVLAAEGDNVVATSKDYMTVEYSADNAKTMIETSAPEQPTLNGYEDWLFAGWYKNATCTSPIRTKGEATGTCYAKFVPADILSVKCQVLSGTTSSSDKTNMRFTTSIDTNQYLNVGFVISRADKDYTYETKQAYQRIEASATAGVVYEYSPKVIDTKSEAFVTYTIKNIPNTEGSKYFDTVFMAKPYWTTWDGVRVYGVTKYAAVEDSYNDVVNIPVKVAESAEVYTTSDFNVVESDKTVNETLSAVRYNANENYVAVVMSGKNSLPSATKYTVSQDERVTTYIHRNLETKYAGTDTEDTTWYDVYKDDNGNVTEDEFVIATSADFYGLSKISKNASKLKEETLFNGKTIYVISDIEANIGRAMPTGWSTVEEDGETAIKGATLYEWYKVGTAGKPFAGTFDGQGHTISGINYTSSEGRVGMFGQTAANSMVKNFKLTNSYFGSTLTSGDVYLGAVAGYGCGDFESIKSEAYINSGAGRNGGIVGYMMGESITDCWYSGTMTLGAYGKNSGGIVGMIDSGTVDMSHCLYSGVIGGSGTGTNAAHGGLCGYLYNGATLNIADSLSVGSVTTSTSNWIGSVVGHLRNGDGTVPTVKLKDTYVKEGICESVVRRNSYDGTIYVDGTMLTANTNQNRLNQTAYTNAMTVEELIGCDGYYNGTIALEFDTYWEPVLNGAPELKSFSTASVDIWSGKGTEEKPWMIYNRDELRALSELSSTYNFSGKHIKLGADITVINGNSAEQVKANGTSDNMWKSIGTSGNKFAGKFDGNKKTISGIYLVTGNQYQGLFGCTATGSAIGNFELTNSYFETTKASNAWFGSVAGCVYGTCKTVKSDATVVAGGSNTGGMIGVIYTGGSATIDDCWFAGKLEIGSSVTQCGGVVGAVRLGTGYKASITNCLNTGTITGSSGQIGGICGVWTGGDAEALTISNCVNAKNINLSNGNNGCIIGRTTISGVKISNSYAIKETDADAGRINGSVTSTNNITNCEVKTKSEVQGYDAWYNNVLSLDFDKYWRVVEDDSPVLRSFADDALDTWSGKGTEEEPWVIKTADELILLSTLAESTYNFSGKYIKLGDDITIVEGSSAEQVKTNATTDNMWKPIGTSANKFAGKFDGNKKAISGIYLVTGNQYQGFFGCTATGSEIGNFELTNSYFETTKASNAWFGSVAGCVYGTCKTVKSDTTVVAGGSNTGGMIGVIYTGGSATIDDCWFAGKLEIGSSVTQCGGVVGAVRLGTGYKASITNCLNTGTITGSSGQIGGICGVWTGGDAEALTISNCVNAKNINLSNGNNGCIIGRTTISGVKIINSYAIKETDADAGRINGSVTSTNNITNCEVKTKSEVQGYDAWYNNMLSLDFDKYWSVVEDDSPVLRSFVDNAPDMWSGQGTQASPWVISNKDELELLPTLAQNYNFSGKYIQLGTNEQAGELTIAVNTGTIDEIKEQKPENWKPIGTNANGKRFAGTFNGNGNTISGLYYSGGGNGIGLFGAIDENATVQNLKLTNSYFEYTPTSGNAYIGSVAGFGFGTFKNVKSTAEVVCESAYAGGLVGGLGGYGEAYFNDCWFDGTLRVGKQAKYCGSILGGNNHPVHILNCLNTGTILISKFNGSSISVGGFCGYVNSDMEITNCLNAKSITMNRGYVSAIFGEINSGTTTLTNVYAVVGDGADQSYNGCEYYGHKADAATVTVTGNSWGKLTNEQLRGENAITNASGLFGVDTHWVTGDLYPVLNMAGEVYPSIPAMSISNESNTLTKLTGDGNFVTTVTGTTKENYDDYLTSVVAAQFVKVADNTIDNSVYSTTYTRDGLVLCVTYFAKQNQTTISYYEGAVSDHLVYNADDVAGNAENAKTTMSMMELFAYGNSFVIQLKNGHFLISDGGMEYEIEYLLDYLDELTPGDAIPVVEGWFITHAHEDHCGAINVFYDREDLVSRVHVEGVYYSSPNDENVLKNAGGGESKDYVLTRVVRGVLRNSKGEPTAFYRPQTGQRYYFNDTTIDILLAQEQLSVDATEANIKYRGNLNSSSTVCLFTSENQTCLLSGDLEETGFDWLFGNYNETLFSTLDFFTLNHHGFNTSETIANKITANTALLTLRDNYDDRCAEYIELLIGKAKESMAWGTGTVVFTFPHTAGNQSYQRLEQNTWKYHEGVERPIQENIDGNLQ